MSGDYIDLNEAFQNALISENYEKRYGKPPEWSLKNNITFFLYWYFFGGNKYHRNLHIYALGADDYNKSYQKILRSAKDKTG
jgi:hypothetical protein